MNSHQMNLVFFHTREYERKLNSFDANSLERSAKLNLMVAKFSAENQKRQFESFEYHQGPFIQFYGSHLGFVDFMTDTHRIGDKKDASFLSPIL